MANKVWVVEREAAGIRLKQWLQKNGTPTYSRSLAYEWIAEPNLPGMLGRENWEAKEVEPYAK